MTIEELEHELHEIDKGYNASRDADGCLVIKYNDEVIAVQIAEKDYMFDNGNPKLTAKLLAWIDYFLSGGRNNDE